MYGGFFFGIGHTYYFLSTSNLTLFFPYVHHYDYEGPMFYFIYMYIYIHIYTHIHIYNKLYPN